MRHEFGRKQNEKAKYNDRSFDADNSCSVLIRTHQMSSGNIDMLTITAEKHTIRYCVGVIGQKDYFSWMENEKTQAAVLTDLPAQIVEP